MPQNPNCLALEDLSQKQLLESLQNDSDFGPKFTITWQGSLPEPASSKSHRCLWKDGICQDDIPEKLSKAEVREAQCPVGYLVASTNLKTFTRIIHILKASFALGWNSSIAVCNEMFPHPNWHLNFRLLYQVGPYVCSLGLFL